MAVKYYAVKRGRKTGIFNTWDECKAQVSGFSGASYKSFLSKEEAEQFLGEGQETQEVEQFLGEGQKMQEADKNGVIAYVDGSYHIHTKEFSYGMVILRDGTEHCFSKKFEDPELAKMRNVAGEIMGARAAMEYALQQGITSLTIYHDYEGIAKWCLNEWKTNKEGTRQYKEFYDSIKDKVSIRFVKVKGHSNDKYNDLADRLAKDALGIS